ncbi:Phytochromobilin:ferredoxin oxidoreductase [Morus notabilis]|uniref:Phytochromobilin:ferredoxin oxidoreductase n=1 Tax=Morus notabilis TaxID=981085 RepID=W9RF84_9ROSA|nr:Phytochromobilin:ferredoxin oxidoreductase [Morus notabilis]
MSGASVEALIFFNGNFFFFLFFFFFVALPSTTNSSATYQHSLTDESQESYSSMISTDGTVELQMRSFQAPKIRLLRSLSIERETMQVLDFAVFPKPEYDLPIFCANFFSNASTNIVLLDLNPLHDIISQRDYREKYYKSLMPLGVKYAEAWLELMDEATEENNESRITGNREAQHRYLAWRAEKDPGHGVLKKLVGHTAAKNLLRNFLFHGINELGSKGFLDYFPEYRSEDGTVIERRSIIGKSFENRPWDARGEFIGNN